MSSDYVYTDIGGYRAVVLRLDNDVFNSEIIVASEFGANLLKFIYNGKTVIDYSEDALKRQDFTGTPILFPTPNRVLNAEVVYNNKTYKQQKNGEKRVCHGLVYDEPFEVCKIKCGDYSASIELALDINKNTAFFEAFPFECRLHIIYLIDEYGLTVKYILKNLSDCGFQFGFGIHPYFNYNKEDRVLVPSFVLPELKNNYPTGEIVNTETMFSGISTTGAAISDLSVDNDFIRKEQGAVYILNGESVRIEIKPSEQFRHFVLYRNKSDNFICIEPQTCCINAHNLAAAGFKYADLLNIMPGEVSRGYIKINVSDTKNISCVNS